MLTGPAQPPLACAVNQIEHQSDYAEDRKYSGEQHQGRQHLLNKIDLQPNQCHNSENHPLASFLVAELFSEALTDFHWDEPFPGTSDLMQITAQTTHFPLKT